MPERQRAAKTLGVFLFFFFVTIVTFYRLLEILNPFTDSLSHFGKALRAKQEKDDDQNNYEFWHT